MIVAAPPSKDPIRNLWITLVGVSLGSGTMIFLGYWEASPELGVLGFVRVWDVVPLVSTSILIGLFFFFGLCASFFFAQGHYSRFKTNNAGFALLAPVLTFWWLPSSAELGLMDGFRGQTHLMFFMLVVCQLVGFRVIQVGFWFRGRGQRLHAPQSESTSTRA